MTNEEKLANFQAMTMEAARARGNNELDAYRKSLDKVFEEHKEMKEQQAEAAIKAERENLQREKNKVVSLEQIKIRHESMQHYEDLKQKLFNEVHTMLDEFMSTSDYQKLLVKLIKKDVRFARNDEVIIYIDPADKEHLPGLEAATGATLTLSEYSFGGGVRAVIPNRNVLIDDSFETKMKEHMESFSFTGGESYGE